MWLLLFSINHLFALTSMVSNIVIKYSFICTQQYVLQTFQLKSSVYSQLNGQTVLFLTIWFNVGHLFAHNLNHKQFYLTHIGPYQMLPLWVGVNLRVMAIKGYSTFPQSSSAGALLSDCLISHPGHLLVMEDGLSLWQRCKWAKENLCVWLWISYCQTYGLHFW